MRLTCVQNQMIYALVERGGRVRSLLHLTCELSIDYRHARRCLGRLERAGLVTVERRVGHPLVMVASPRQFETFVSLSQPDDLTAKG